ncbi:MAG: hypothetical protein LBQ49_03275 [Rickettsiales bacterium]|nr:hypothetical protein [Rickettsiales bacterium]
MTSVDPDGQVKVGSVRSAEREQMSFVSYRTQSAQYFAQYCRQPTAPALRNMRRNTQGAPLSPAGQV